MSSTNNPSKKRPRDQDEDEEQADQEQRLPLADGGVGTPAKAPPGVSPPGTKLRSGRKVKPRRSLEEKMERSKKRPKTDDSEEEEEDAEMDQDEEMNEHESGNDQLAFHEEEEEEEEKEEDQKQPPKAATAKMPPIPGNLRLPLQHTPGRVTTKSAVPPTAVLAAAEPPAGARRSDATSSNEIGLPPPQHYQKKQQRMKITKTPHKPAGTTIASPDVEQRNLFDGKSPSESPTGETTTTQQPAATAAAEQGGMPLLNQMPFPPPWLEEALELPWVMGGAIFILFILGSFLVGPVYWDSAVSVSKLLVPCYQSVLGSPKSKALPDAIVVSPPAPDTIKDKVLSEETRSLIETSKKLNQTLLERQQEQSTAWQELDQVRILLDEQSEAVETQLEALQSSKTQVEAKLQTTFSLWKQYSQELNRIAARSDEVLVLGSHDPDEFFSFTQSLEEKDARALLHTWDLGLWEPQMESCNVPELEDLLPEEAQQQQDAEQPEAVTREYVTEYWDQLRSDLGEELEALQKDSGWTKDILKWVQDYADATELPEYEVPEIPKPQNVKAATTTRPKGQGPTGDSIRRLVDARLEVDRADGTGRTDYAALFQGASVVKTGSRATSPSLADKLPLLNRLMAVMGAQFYGYGPEAALTPSYPADALGQCWAFVEDEPPNKFGSYAVLTVQLAKPISVQSVSIEHPLSDQLNKSRSSIRHFRVYGYVDKEAASEPISLGAFQFEKNNKKRKLREVFDLEGDNDESIPKLSAVSLVIDSTWGADYACLYRFRVHGKHKS